MNKKIKEIDIKAFRAYKDLQKFEFLHRNSGKVANLVAIYAPNGYGKTSFFDAIEWAITGKIERLDTGKPIKEEVKNETDYILKNKESNEDYGTVTIISEDNDIYSVNTKKKTKNMKSDFKKGIVEKISPALKTIYNEDESFCTTNLLAHDKITGFLQNYTAQDKTSELRVMWDENNYLEILNGINELYNELDKKKNQLSLEISKEEKELNKYKYENNQNDKVVKLLSNYETKYNKQFMNNDSFNIEEIKVLFNEFHAESQKEREEKEKECNDIEILLKDYPVFEANKKKKCLLQEKKEEYNKAIEIWNKVEQIKKEKEKKTKEIEQVRYLLDNLEEFYSYIDQINLNIMEIENIKNKEISCQKQKISIEEKIQEFDEKAKNNNIVLKKINDKEEQLKKDYYEYNDNKVKEEKYKRLINKSKYILEQRNKRIQDGEIYIEQIDLFLAGKLESGLLDNIFTEEIILKCDSVKKLKTELKLLTENKSILESNKKILVELFDKVQQLSIKGKDIVIEQKKRECPLCHMEYHDYNELLDRIEVTTEENVELVRIDELIKKNTERELEIDKKLNVLIEEVESQINFISNTYKDKCIKERKKVKRLQMVKERLEENLNSVIYVCNKLEEKYQQQNIDISVYDQLKDNVMKIETERKVIKEDIEKISNSMKEEKNKEKKLEEKIQNYKLRILEIKELINNINAKRMYIEVKKCLEDKGMSYSEYNYIGMKSLIEADQNQLNHEKKDYNKELTRYNLKDMNSKNEYLLNLNECCKEINELEVKISSYLQRCEKMIGTKNQKNLVLQINQVNEILKNELGILEERIQSETSILVGINGLYEQKIWMSRKQSIEVDKKNLDFLSERIEKLKESKQYVENYIVEKTNEYFNSDIINQIYNKIDPHPTMKHIKFVTEKDKSGLKTRIYTYDDSENNKMSPVVYLSSAQVNILSLCIFLSKVLSEKDTTFNTIFIDDPIQHLDGINLLSFIDVLRIITTDLGRQIVVSTHNEQFYKLLKVKMDENYYSSRFIELTSTGRIKK